MPTPCMPPFRKPLTWHAGKRFKAPTLQAAENRGRDAENGGRGAEIGGRDADGALLQLPYDATEAIFAHLPLAQKARAALVCKPWAALHSASLVARQQQLKALRIPQQFMGRVRGLDCNSELLEVLREVQYRLCHGINGKWLVDNYGEFNDEGSCVARFSHRRFPEKFTMMSETYLDPADPSTRLLDLHVAVGRSDFLPWILGLLLVLAQDVRADSPTPLGSVPHPVLSSMVFCVSNSPPLLILPKLPCVVAPLSAPGGYQQISRSLLVYSSQKVYYIM